jgi:hypothetical protein
MQILSTLSSFEHKLVLEHVEGHQDKKCPKRDLPWEAQLDQ